MVVSICQVRKQVVVSRPIPAARALDVDALERAAARISHAGAAASAAPDAGHRYQGTRPAETAPGVHTRSKPPESIFGSDLLSEKSLDEVILSYLAEDLDPQTEKK